MKKITTLTFLLLSSAVLARNHNAIHVQHHGKMATIPDNAPVMTHQAAARRHAVRVSPLNLNQRGAAHIKGSIRGLGMAAYRFHGQAGQQVKIAPIGNNYSMLFGLFDQTRGMNFGTTHILPTTGEYEIRIVQTRKNAAHNRRYYRYNANVYLGSTAAHQYAAPAPVKTHVPPLSQVATAQSAHGSSTDYYQIAPNTTPDGSRRVVSTSDPLHGPRTGKISALPRQGVVEEQITNHRHINYHSEPVVSHSKSDQKPNKKRQAASKKGFTKNYRCQSGGTLKITHKGSEVTVKSRNIALDLQENTSQSYGGNKIYTGNGGFLHLIKKKKSSSPEVLSFEYQGKTLAFGCK